MDPARGTERVDLDEIQDAATAGGAEKRKTLPEIGLEAFRALLVFTGFSLLLLAVFGWLTYPGLEAVERLEEPGNVLATFQEQQAEWFTRIKDLGQLYILTPLLPLLGLVLGYIFGRQTGRTESQ